MGKICFNKIDSKRHINTRANMFMIVFKNDIFKVLPTTNILNKFQLFKQYSCYYNNNEKKHRHKF